MGRLLFFIVIIAAILAGVWFFVPGGDDMMRSWMGKSEAPATEATDDAAAGADSGGIDSEDGVDAIDAPASDAAPADSSGDEPAGEPQGR